MAYEVRYTDTVNKGSIIVDDNTLNTETSLSIPGRGTTAYGQAFAEGLLHLLENFANSSAPERPVEGQLWYDTSSGVDQLKIYDGTTWVAAGGLKRSISEPSVTNSIAGELWVNTETKQLYLFTGASWVLVGPDFTDGLVTGAKPETIIGADNLEYNCLVVRIDNIPRVIISSKTFLPKSTIDGFRSGINAGINISTSPAVLGDTLKYWGIAEKAESLIVNGVAIPASNFLKSSDVSTTNFQLRVKSDDGVQIGLGGQFNVGVDNNVGVLQNNVNGSAIDLRLREGTSTNIVMRVDSTKRVGINNIAPEEDLDVVGNVRISSRPGNLTTGFLKIESTINSTDIDEGSLIVNGGVGIALNLNVGGNTDLSGGVLTTNNIAPDSNNARNIGTSSNKYDQVYANTFFGNLQGNVSGTVTGRAGNADRLTTATTFALSGDVNPSSFAFDGQTGGTTKTFDVRISNSFISNKDVVFDAGNADEILLNVTTGTTGVYKITKRNFLKTIPLVPPGVIVPYGGEEAPEGWLLCDGSEIRKSDYNTLWLAIGFNFKDASLISDGGVNFFALPDFRGRFPLGLDNMGGPSANRVTSTAADGLGNSSGSETKTIELENLPEHEHDLEGETGNQYYALRIASGSPVDASAITFPIEPGLGGTHALATSGGVKKPVTTTLGTPIDVMNPYVAVNYIIYTGQ